MDQTKIVAYFKVSTRKQGDSVLGLEGRLYNLDPTAYLADVMTKITAGFRGARQAGKSYLVRKFARQQDGGGTRLRPPPAVLLLRNAIFQQ